MNDQRQDPPEPGSSISWSGDAKAAPAKSSEEFAGAAIGPYKLLQELGKGGMGVVWMAQQREPVQRVVAVKIIKASLNGPNAVARFEAERQALAMMDHPNISRVLDAGTTATGRPYFVMELVKGVPFNKFCDQERLTLKDRIELFIIVCNAVQHAHQKGIVHRDLKPSNVLVAVYDGKPVPKVIDFGIAKATTQKASDRQQVTEVGQMVGTPEYMAPEQAEVNNLDIDTRADIYSLGIMLYEMLTGVTPFSTRQLRGASFIDMLRLIKEVEPPRPSTRLSTSTELSAIAANRRLEPRRLRGMVRGDLDWIVMKCLEKDRDQRYETANQLGDELGRFLTDQPVQARPPSVGYRAKKFLRRNKGGVLAATLVLLALVGGIVGTAIGFVQAEWALEAEVEQRGVAEARELEARKATAEAERATRKALEAAEAEKTARADAEKAAAAEKLATEKALAAAKAEREANQTAQKRLAQIQKARTILASVFKDLDPRAEETGRATLRDQLVKKLAQIVKDLEADAKDDPGWAELRAELGEMARALGDRSTELKLLRNAMAGLERTGKHKREYKNAIDALKAKNWLIRIVAIETDKRHFLADRLDLALAAGVLKDADILKEAADGAAKMLADGAARPEDREQTFYWLAKAYRASDTAGKQADKVFQLCDETLKVNPGGTSEWRRLAAQEGAAHALAVGTECVRNVANGTANRQELESAIAMSKKARHFAAQLRSLALEIAADRNRDAFALLLDATSAKHPDGAPLEVGKIFLAELPGKLDDFHVPIVIYKLKYLPEMGFFEMKNDFLKKETANPYFEKTIAEARQAQKVSPALAEPDGQWRKKTHGVLCRRLFECLTRYAGKGFDVMNSEQGEFNKAHISKLDKVLRHYKAAKELLESADFLETPDVKDLLSEELTPRGRFFLNVGNTYLALGRSYEAHDRPQALKQFGNARREFGRIPPEYRSTMPAAERNGLLQVEATLEKILAD